MPYSGSSDPTLPSNVKKLPSKKRRQWVNIANSIMARGGSDGDAIRQANGAVKEMEFDIRCACKEVLHVAEGAKATTCGACSRVLSLAWKETGSKDGDYASEVEVVSMYQPYGGATSFNEIDDYMQGMELSYNVNETKAMFDAVFCNIWADKELTSDQQIAATQTAANDMVQRMLAPKSGTREFTVSGAGGYINKVKALLGMKSDAPQIVGEKVGVSDTFLTVTKDVGGVYRWLAVFSNQFKDREGEIFAEAAHKNYEAWVDKTKMYPELRLWHVPGSRVGVADLITYADGFILASGTFDKGMEDVAESLAATKDLAVSHGYVYPERAKKSGVFNEYYSYEISPLPGARAANTWTVFEQLQQEGMMITNKEKREFMVTHLGPERTARIEALLPAFQKELQGTNIGWKDFTDAMAEGEGSPSQGQVAPVETANASAEASAGAGASPEQPATGVTSAATAVADPPATNASPAATDEEKAAADEKALAPIAALIERAFAPIGERLTAVEANIKELSKTADERVAETMKPRADVAAMTAATRPTDSPNNLVTGDKAAELAAQAEAPASQQGSPAQKAARDLVGPLLGWQQQT